MERQHESREALALRADLVPLSSPRRGGPIQPVMRREVKILQGETGMRLVWM
jgi:hypothetical protein